MTTYSADSHIVEPAELFAPLERKYGERAPRIVNDPDWGDFLVTPGVTGREAYSPRYAGVAVGQGIAGGRLNDPEVVERIKRGYAGLRQRIVDPVERLKEQDLDGVGLEVLYPSMYFRIFGLPDTEVLLEAFRSYNDWLAGYMSQSPGRLLGMALLPMQEQEAAAGELEPSPPAHGAGGLTTTRRTTGSGRWRRRPGSL